MSARSLLAAVAVVGALALPARADRFGGGAWAHYELTGLYAIDDAPMARSTELVLGGARVGGFFGKRLALAAAFDFAFGSTIERAGFAYEASLQPVGIGLRPTSRTVLALTTGVAISGAVGTLDDAVALPLELTAEATLGPLRLLARGRASWLAGADARQRGAPHATWTDELDATVGVRIGPRYDRWSMHSGNGYFLGASYRELGGVRFAGLVIGYSVDAATKRGDW